MSAQVLRFDIERLANGLTVIGEHNPDAVSCAAGYLVRAGARDETPEVAGVSHFLEHMLFKGNEHLKADDINRGFDEMGAAYNAFTSEERTVYYGAVLPERAPELLHLLTQLMRPTLRLEDFEVEKKVILEEIAMYQDQPARRLFDLATERYWADHPLGHSVLGSIESVGALKRDQMQAYYDQRYSPSNIILAIAGNYDWNATVAQASELTAGWPDQVITRDRPAAQPMSGRQNIVDDNLNRAHVALYAPGVALESDERYAAAILASAIGDDSGSRLYWELVDKGLCDSAWLGHESSEGAGAFVGYLSAAPAKVEGVLERFQRVLKQVQAEGVSEAEWQRAQRKLATGITLRAETPQGRLMSFASNYQVFGRYEGVNDVVNKVLGIPLSAGTGLLAGRPFDDSFVLSLGPSTEAAE